MDWEHAHGSLEDDAEELLRTNVAVEVADVG
jgi:hypothetical protein